MASPTEAEIITQFKNVIKIYEEIRKFCESNATNFISLEDTLTQSIESDYAPEILSTIASTRADLDSSLRKASSAMTPLLRTWAKFMTGADLAPETDVQSMITRLYNRMITSGDRVLTRSFTFNTPSAGGSNVGNGNIRRLTVDERNFSLEATHPESKVARCISDQNTGQTKHEELFELRGQPANKDLCNLVGSGEGFKVLLKCPSARDSLLNNASFSQFSGTAAVPTAITDWTVASSIANFEIDTTNFYRGFGADSSTERRSLNIKANDSISQALSVRRTSLDPSRPYHLQIAFNREIGGTNGTLRIRLGAQTTTVALSAQTGWNLLLMPIGQNSWYRNFDENDLDIVIGLEGASTFGLRVDDAILTPFVPFDGTFYTIIGGSTPFMREDEYTWSDTATDSVVQRWFWRAFGRHLPSATPAVNFTDP